MKQKITLLLIFLFVTIIYGQKGSYEVTASELNIRETHSKESNAIGKVVKGDIIDVESIEGDWARITFTDENGNEREGYISTKYIMSVDSRDTSQTPKDKTFLYIIATIGLITLGCYITALVKTRNGEMTTIVNWYDFALLCASFTIPTIGLFLGYEEGKGFDNMTKGYIGLGGLCLLGSAIWSVVANRDNYFHAFLSVMAKIFIVLVMIIVILVIFFNMMRRTTKTVGGKQVPMNMYEQRRHDKNRERNIAVASSVAGMLVLSLIGSHLNTSNNESI